MMTLRVMEFGLKLNSSLHRFEHLYSNLLLLFRLIIYARTTSSYTQSTSLSMI